MGTYRSATTLTALSRTKNSISVISRILLATVGGYCFAWGFTALATLLLMSLMPKSEAVITATMIGFIVYLIAALWVFAVRSLVLSWLVIVGGSALMMQIAYFFAKG